VRVVGERVVAFITARHATQQKEKKSPDTVRALFFYALKFFDAPKNPTRLFPAVNFLIADSSRALRDGAMYGGYDDWSAGWQALRCHPGLSRKTRTSMQVRRRRGNGSRRAISPVENKNVSATGLKHAAMKKEGEIK
jgi:hypothetical protein